jgi:hypothetical protein
VSFSHTNVCPGNKTGNKLRKTELDSEASNPIKPGLFASAAPHPSGWGPGGRRFKSCLPDESHGSRTLDLAANAGESRENTGVLGRRFSRVPGFPTPGTAKGPQRRRCGPPRYAQRDHLREPEAKTGRRKHESVAGRAARGPHSLGVPATRLAAPLGALAQTRRSTSAVATSKMPIHDAAETPRLFEINRLAHLAAPGYGRRHSRRVSGVGRWRPSSPASAVAP